MEKTMLKPRKAVMQLACSGGLFKVLNTEFQNDLKMEEKASVPLAGGVLQQSQNCGMIWGSALAVGAEVYKNNPDVGSAIQQTVAVSKDVMDSYEEHTNTVFCKDIHGCDFTKPGGLAKYLLTGRFMRCMRLADSWAEKSIDSAKTGLKAENEIPLENVRSCASEVVILMGGDDKQTVMVAGFAGGIGLSGNTCGALSAAVWMKSLTWLKQNPDKSNVPNSVTKGILKAFKKETNGEMLCHKICGRKFENMKDHTEYVNNGGCGKLINILTKS